MLEISDRSNTPSVG